MTEPVRRSREIEDFSKQYIIAPAIDWVVPVFAKLRVSPNFVSVAGLLAGVFAAGFLTQYTTSYFYSLAALLMLLAWHVFDGADGRLARLTNTQSEFGKVVDGICDYVVFISIYCVIGWLLMAEYGANIWFLVVLAGLMHAFQAGAYEFQRQEFEFWGRGKKSAELPDLNAMKSLGKERSFFERFAHHLSIVYARMQYQFSGIKEEVRPAIYKHVEALDDVALEDFRVRYRFLSARQVLKWGIMCPHYRSFMIIGSFLIMQPELYLIIEAFLLPMVHIYLVHNQNKFNVDLVKRLTGAGVWQ